jgi:hypothetical protein
MSLMPSGMPSMGDSGLPARQVSRLANLGSKERFMVPPSRMDAPMEACCDH